VKPENLFGASIGEYVANTTHSPNSGHLLEIARLRMILSKFQSVTDWIVETFNVSPRRYQTLLVLRMNEQNGGMAITEVGEAIGIKRNTCTELLNRMESDGLVERNRQQEDRRVVKISLTGQGRALVTRIAEADRKRLAEIEQEMRVLLNSPMH
jgi:DNA-binding MarR family transcriptional regulator